MVSKTKEMDSHQYEVLELSVLRDRPVIRKIVKFINPFLMLKID